LRRWPAPSAQARQRTDRHDIVMRGLRGKLKVGCKVSRESMNAR
jgi:hypothetical protein